MNDPTVAGRITPAEPLVDQLAGRGVVQTYTNLAEEYAALSEHAVVVDRSHRARVRLTGNKAAEMIAGLVTNDTQALAPGQGQYSAALSPKGKIIADVRIFVEEGSILTDTGARAGDGWRTMVKKYVNPRVAPHTDETEQVRDLGIFGPNARHVVETITGINSSALSILPDYAHLRVDVDSASIIVAQTPEVIGGGYELFVPAAAFDAIWHQARKAGAVPCGLAAWEVARVEAGRPEWGLDMDDSTLTQEANMDELNAVSYTKGCYVGQEYVARVHFKGHVNRHLRGLRASGTAALPSGATVQDDTGKVVGDVRSSVLSPRLGPIALGMLRREIEFDQVLTAHWEGGEDSVRACAIPFASQ